MDIPESILRGQSELCEFLRPGRKPTDWIAFHERLLAAPEAYLLVCYPDDTEGSRRNSHLLHSVCQLAIAPDTNYEGAPELTAFKDSMKLIVGVFKQLGSPGLVRRQFR